MVGVPDLIGAVLHRRAVKSFQGHFHVGLTGCEPHIADHDVVERDVVVRYYGELIWTARRLWRKVHTPLTEAVRGCRAVDAAHRDGNFLVRVGPPPDMDGPVPLENHVTAENRRHSRIAFAWQHGAGGQSCKAEKTAPIRHYYASATLITSLPKFSPRNNLSIVSGKVS